MGSLVPHKSFHYLLECMPNLVKNIPEIHLNVIGSNKTYKPNSLFKTEYENKILTYIKSNKLEKFITLHGNIDIQKKQVIFNKTKIGIANPTGASETFCLSAAEFSLNEIPVIAGKKNGLFDTVVNNKTGFLITSKKDLIKKIIYLYHNEEKSIKIGKYGKKYISKNYNYKIIQNKWIDYLKSKKKKKTLKFLNPIYRIDKVLIKFNKWIQFIFGEYVYIPTVYEYYGFIKKIAKGIK